MYWCIFVWHFLGFFGPSFSGGVLCESISNPTLCFHYRTPSWIHDSNHFTEKVAGWESHPKGTWTQKCLYFHTETIVLLQWDRNHSKSHCNIVWPILESYRCRLESSGHLATVLLMSHVKVGHSEEKEIIFFTLEIQMWWKTWMFCPHHLRWSNEEWRWRFIEVH